MYDSAVDFAEEEFSIREELPREIQTPIPVDYIFIPDNYEYFKVMLDDIIYVEADGSYVKICTRAKAYQISTNLKSFSNQLQSPQFIRVSRKHIVNMKYIERINGVYLALKDCSGSEYKIPFSKRKRHEILSVLPIIKIKH